MTLRERIRSRLKHGIIGSILVLIMGNTMSMLVKFLTIPILTRIFPPEMYGKAAIALSVSAILASVCHLRYHVGVPVAKYEYQATALTRLSIQATLGVTLLLLAALLLAGDSISSLVSIDLPLLYWAVPLMTLSALVFIVQMVCLRQEQFKLLSTSRVWGSILSRAVVLLSVLVIPGSFLHLIWIKLLHDLVILGATYREVRGRLQGLLRPDRPLRATARRFKEFPRYCYADLLVIANSEVVTLVVGLLYDARIAAFYALTLKAIREPILVVGSAVSRVFFQRVSAEVAGNREVATLTRMTLSVQLVLFTYPLLVFAYYAPDLFATLFGAEWREAGYYLRYFTPMLLMNMMSLPSNTLLDTLMLQKQRMLFHLVQLTATAAVLIIFPYIAGVEALLIALSLASSVVIVVKTYWILAKVNLSVSQTTAAMLVPLGGGVALFGLFVAIAENTSLIMGVLAAAGLTGVCAGMFFLPQSPLSVVRGARK